MSCTHDLVVLACAGTGREIREIAQEKFNVLGFLDDNKVGPEVLGKISDWPRFADKAKLCSGLGSYRSMNRRREILSTIDIAYFTNVVASDSRIYASAELGPGILVFPYSVVSAGARIGSHVLIYHNCVIAHDSIVRDYSIVSNSVTISGNVDIGENCYIGAGVTILEGITIGANTIIAAGATVVKPVGANTIYITKDIVKPNHYNAWSESRMCHDRNY